MFILSANQSPYIWLIVPLVICQYILAIFCLLKLLFLELPRPKYWVWNFFILLVFYVGGITFLLCRYVFKIFPLPIPKTSVAEATDATTEATELNETSEPIKNDATEQE